MLYDFEIRINMCKNKSCSDNLNIYKSQKEPNLKVIILQVNLIQRKKNLKNHLWYFIEKDSIFIGEYIKFI